MSTLVLCCLSFGLVAQDFDICSAHSGVQFPLWDDSVGAYVTQSTITPFLTSASNIAVIVFPGGSYFWLGAHGEGDEVGRWLQKHGINAFVVRYRVPGWWAWFSHSRFLIRGKCHPDMFDDGQQAIRWVIIHAKQYGIDVNKVGMMGFSAGGHLVLVQACYGKSLRPAFVAAVYPVVTMADVCVHKRSRRGLLGERWKEKKELCDALSVERHIPVDCPPVFMVSCDDDPTVDCRNFQMLDSALVDKEVPHYWFHCSTGGHGFGVSEKKGSVESRGWKYHFLQWIEKQYCLGTDGDTIRDRYECLDNGKAEFSPYTTIDCL